MVLNLVSTEDKDRITRGGNRRVVDSHDGAIILTESSNGSVVLRCSMCHTRIEWCTCGKQAPRIIAYRPSPAAVPNQPDGVVTVQDSHPADADTVPGVPELHSITRHADPDKQRKRKTANASI